MVHQVICHKYENIDVDDGDNVSMLMLMMMMKKMRRKFCQELQECEQTRQSSRGGIEAAGK